MAFLIVKKFPKNLKSKSLIIVISRAASKKAVLRNKIKRRIRVITKEILKDSGFTYMIIVKKEAINLTYKELKQETTKAFQKHGYFIS